MPGYITMLGTTSLPPCAGIVLLEKVDSRAVIQVTYKYKDRKVGNIVVVGSAGFQPYTPYMFTCTCCSVWLALQAHGCRPI